jgi:hypothetical protein
MDSYDFRILFPLSANFMPIFNAKLSRIYFTNESKALTPLGKIYPLPAFGSVGLNSLVCFSCLDPRP